MAARYACIAGVFGTALALGACEHREPTTPLPAESVPTAAPPTAPNAVRAELREPSPEEIWKRIEGCWYEAEILDCGKHGYGSGEQYGWRFNTDGAENWVLTGELQTSSYGEIHLDTSVTPWRFDIIDKHSRAKDKQHAVWAGIIEFQGKDLVWTSFSDWSSMTPGDAFPPGPRDFTSTKENRQIRRVLNRCEYLQTRFP